MANIRIISNGNGVPGCTRVFDVQTGVELRGMTDIKWHISVDSIAVATITFTNVEVDVIGRIE